jgi:hypothetical protein
MDGMSGAERSRDAEILEESDTRAERAADRIEPVSVSVSLDVDAGLAGFAVLELEIDAEVPTEEDAPLITCDDSPDRWPLGRGREDDDALDGGDDGDNNSGVDGRVVESTVASSRPG